MADIEKEVEALAKEFKGKSESQFKFHLMRLKRQKLIVKIMHDNMMHEIALSFKVFN